VGEWLAIMALDKHGRQPSIFVSPLTTHSVLSARSFLPVPFVSGQTKSAQRPPHGGQQSARVRYQCLNFQCGSVTMAQECPPSGCRLWERAAFYISYPLVSTKI
jgi:hypothetical protein